MKNLCVTLFCLSIVFNSEAQDLQRLEIPVQNISIPAGSGHTNVDPVTSFCVDFNRYSKFDGKDDYSHVTLDVECVKIGQNPPITLQAALDQGLIEMKVNHYDNIVFTNRTGQPIEIDISKAVVLGKNKADITNLVLPHVPGPGGVENQNNIWI